jgi:hypothetical protein
MGAVVHGGGCDRCRARAARYHGPSAQAYGGPRRIRTSDWITGLLCSLTSRPVADLGLCIARSGNPTFANRQITLVASPRCHRRRYAKPRTQCSYSAVVAQCHISPAKRTRASDSDQPPIATDLRDYHIVSLKLAYRRAQQPRSRTIACRTLPKQTRLVQCPKASILRTSADAADTGLFDEAGRMSSALSCEIVDLLFEVRSLGLLVPQHELNGASGHYGCGVPVVGFEELIV